MSSKSYESLNQLRLQKTGDVIIKIGGHEFHAHRVVLRRRMKYFRDLFSEGRSLFIWYSKKKKSTIKLDPETIDPTYFSDLLNYVYTFEIDLTNENIRGIYRIADYFRFYKLMDKVKEHLENNVNEKNIFYYQRIAREFELKSFEDFFKKLIYKHYLFNMNEFSRNKVFSAWSFEYLKNLLENMKKNERFEEMFHYSVNWILADEVNRSGMLLEVLKNISLESLSFDFLKAASHYELIRKDRECLKLFFDAFITALKSDVRKERRQRIDNLYAKYILYAFGGSDEQELSSVSEYNSATREWTATTPMLSKRTNFGCAVIGHRIYVCGGHDGEREMNELTVFDTYTRTWTELTPMKHARQLCGVAVLNEQIYVAGVCYDDDDELAVVERYCVQSQQWKDVAPMLTNRSGLELVALNGFLYAIGGHDGVDRLNSVERYYPQTDQWTRISSTIHKYYAFGSAVWNDNIYIVGNDKCEVYSPADDKWTEMPAPSKCGLGRRLAVYNGKLYATGGLIEELNGWKSIKTVEVYDFQARVWRTEPDMDLARSFHGVAVAKKSFFVSIKVAFEANGRLNELRLQNTGCDVILEIGCHEFPAHRKVLIARLDHFRNILTVHTEQENKSVISLDLKIIDSTFFGKILNYIYTSKITFTEENIRPIYKAAEYFHFDELIYELEEHMEFTVNIDNVRSYMSIATELGLESLQRVFAQFIIQQIFSDINRRSREKLIPTLSELEQFERTLQKFEENGRVESMLYYAFDWIANDEVNRSRRLFKLLKNIPLQKLSSDFLLEVVSQNEFIRNDIECLNLLLNAIITVPTSHNESREHSLYAIGGKDEQTLSSVSQYNSTTCKWTATTPMPSKRTDFGCAVIGHKIYVCGGHDEALVMNSLTVFDTLTRTWTQLTSMKHTRQHCGVAVLNGHIYVAGGWNGTDILAVVERYNVQTDQWKDATPMTTKRSQLELVELSGFLYAIGGFDGDDALNIVERYDPQIDQWTPMSDTNNKYNEFGSAVWNDNIYIAGENKCEIYNTTFKRWIEVPAPSECSYGQRLAVFDGKLYAIGGVVGESEEWKEWTEWKEWKGIKTVKVYDFEARVWRQEPDMDVARCNHRVAVVKN